MITKSNRFHGYNSLNWVYRNGKTLRDPKLSLKYSVNSKRKQFRTAVVVSRKISKSAVVRNRIRRRIYDIVRRTSDQISSSYDLVFTIHDVEVVNLTHQQLQDLIIDLLKRADVVDSES